MTADGLPAGGLPPEDVAALAAGLRRYAPVDDSSVAAFAALMRPLALAAGESFRMEEDGGSRLAYVKSGVIRFYYVDEDGSEATRAFVRAGSFVAASDALFRGGRASFFAEAATDAALLVARGGFRAQGDAGIFSSPSMARLAIAIMEERLRAKDRRIESLIMDSAEKRYLAFLAENPDLPAVVAQKHIATYLGIDPVTLSRIRRKLRGHRGKSGPAGVMIERKDTGGKR